MKWWKWPLADVSFAGVHLGVMQKNMVRTLVSCYAAHWDATHCRSLSALWMGKKELLGRTLWKMVLKWHVDCCAIFMDQHHECYCIALMVAQSTRIAILIDFPRTPSSLDRAGDGTRFVPQLFRRARDWYLCVWCDGIGSGMIVAACAWSWYR